MKRRIKVLERVWSREARGCDECAIGYILLTAQEIEEWRRSGRVPACPACGKPRTSGKIMDRKLWDCL